MSALLLFEKQRIQKSRQWSIGIIKQSTLTNDRFMAELIAFSSTDSSYC